MGYKFAAFIILLTSVFACQQAQKNTVENMESETTKVSVSDTTQEQGARIEFEEDLHNFGNVFQGERVSFSFKFENKGNQELIISMARGSCGCTVPTYPKKPIKPGEKGAINVEFDSENLLGINQKTVTLLTNSRPYGLYTLTIQASVMPQTSDN
jgi:hypothetical protein